MNIFVINCFDPWEHRVDLLYDILSKDGHRVEVLMSDFRHSDKTRRNDNKKGFRFFNAKPYKKNISIARLMSHRSVSKSIFRFVKNTPGIDLLWVLAPPNSFVADAARIKKTNTKIKVVIDIIDLWPESFPIGSIRPLLKPWKNLRDHYLRYADSVVLECNLYKEKLHDYIEGKKVETIYLAREDKDYCPNLNLPDDVISLCYLGSINNIIDIDCIVSILLDLQKVKPTVLHIIGGGERKQELLNKVCLSGSQLVDHGVVYDRLEKQKIFDSCHYGLNIMKKTVCVGLTMKSIDYFEFGLPIINNIHGDTWNIIEEEKCGYNYSPGMSISLEDNRQQRLNSRSFFEKNLTVEGFREKVEKVLFTCEVFNA